jgi:hypothetical protein
MESLLTAYGYSERLRAAVLRGSFISEQEESERDAKRNKRNNRHKEGKRESTVNRNEIAGK